MELVITRYSQTNESTLGIMTVDGKFFCYTLEDAVRTIKVPKKTAIPAGKYKLKIRKELSPLTQRYRDRYGFFKYHIEIDNIPNFDFVYLHVGNTVEDTDGCVLLGLTSTSNILSTGFIGSSAKAFELFYTRVYPLLDKGEEITLEIKSI